MSVLKRKRKESKLEVFHNYVELRKGITEVLLRDFGYDSNKFYKKLKKKYGNKDFDEMNESEKKCYTRDRKRHEGFVLWYIKNERETIIKCLHDINEHIYVANSIYPTCKEELIERRVHQDIAIGQCYRLVQELQYAIETLPVNVNVYLRFSEIIQKEIDLLKAWRKSDNRFKKNFD